MFAACHTRRHPEIPCLQPATPADTREYPLSVPSPGAQAGEKEEDPEGDQDPPEPLQVVSR